jgi:DNA-binding MarR family transcriptional regulator
MVEGSTIFRSMIRQRKHVTEVRPKDNPAAPMGELACTNAALRRAARRLGNLYDDALEPTGLKATQVALMNSIAESEELGGPALQDLAEQLAVQISALTHALGPLLRDGLVELQPDAQDGRVKRGMLTKLGKARLKEAWILWAAANRRVEDVLGPESAKKLRAMADYVSSDAFLDAYEERLPKRK